MQPQQIEAAQLLTAEEGSVSGLVAIEGWLVLESGSSGGWLAAGHDTVPTPVVRLAESKEIHESLLDSRLSPYGGGPYAFVNKATLTGSLQWTDTGYLLSDVDEIAACEMVHMWLKPPTPLKKK